MQSEEELARVSPRKEMLLTIGAFDGVHLGHKYLISQLVKLAKESGFLSGVITFRQHPQEVLSPGTKLPRLTSTEQRIALIRKEGVDQVIALSFTRELSQLRAEEFIKLLKGYLRMRGLVVGPDFALGSLREGTIPALKALGEKMGFTVTVVPPMTIQGEVISSSTIRKALSRGDIGKVSTFLGRPFSLSGRVVAGAGRGKGLGLPTANLDVESQQALPRDGVYVTWAYVAGKIYQSLTNIGRRPTFEGEGRTVEVYILDYQGDLYGKELTIDIIERLRDERRFDTPEQLVQQIQRDIEDGKAILKSYKQNMVRVN